MIISKDTCAYKTLTDLYFLYDLTLPEYLKKCEDCTGQRDCRITLDDLVRIHEEYKTELDIGSVL